MEFKRYKRLRKLALAAFSSEAFIRGVTCKAWWYGVPYWTKAHYERFYGQIREGRKYVDINASLAAA